MQIWDTSGQETFRSIAKSYYRGAVGAVLVFDLTNIDTFKSITYWLNEINSVNEHSTAITLIGNKSDLVIERQVQHEDIELFLFQYPNIDYIETSAKSNINIKQIFYNTAHKIYYNILDKEKISYDEFTGIKIGLGKLDIEIPSKKNNKCCNG